MQLLEGMDVGVGLRGHVGVGGGIVLSSPTVQAESGGERRDAQEHTDKRRCKCCTYSLAAYPCDVPREPQGQKSPKK